jgi:hypothetical protein
MFDPSTKQGEQLRHLKEEYERGREVMKSDYDFYNLVEKCLLDIEDLTPFDAQWIATLDINNTIIKEIKGLAMMLSRFKPADWNKFLDVVIK